jgi:hypothetical protein
MALKLYFFPKLYTRRRKLKTFAVSRLSSVVEKFFPNDELLRILINFSAFTPVFFIVFPAYDLLIFYLIFLICTIVFYKVIVDFDL